MSKHTLGPWFAVQYANYFNLQSEDGYSENNLLDLEVNPNAEADAELMSCAPELLRVLFDLSENVKTLEGVRDLPIMKRILSQADEVLNKVI